MIAFGCAVTHLESYERYAAPGLRRAAEPDSRILSYGSVGSIYRNYNLLLDQAAELDGLEALVLVHQDAELTDDDFCAKVRAALGDPEVAIVGCAGAVGVRSIAWWEGSVTWASFTHRYWEYGGGELPALTWAGAGANPSFARTGEVEVVDGFVMGLSPWAVRELRFDESLGHLHGYDFDICCQAREAGKKVATADLQVVHHHSLELVDDPENWTDAHIRLTEKWADRLPAVGLGVGDWRRRARRAEAEASTARTQAGANRLRADAATRRASELEGALEGIRTSWSWRLTTPLRRLSRLRPSRRGGPR